MTVSFETVSGETARTTASKEGLLFGSHGTFHAPYIVAAQHYPTKDQYRCSLLPGAQGV